MHLCTAGILKGPVVQILYQFKKSSKKGGSVAFNWNIWTFATLPPDLGFSILSMTIGHFQLKIHQKCRDCYSQWSVMPPISILQRFKYVGFSFWGCPWSGLYLVRVSLFITVFMLNRLISKSKMPFLPFRRVRLYSSRTLVGFQNCQPPPVTSFCFLILHKLKKYKRSFTDPKFFYDISIDLGH